MAQHLSETNLRRVLDMLSSDNPSMTVCAKAMGFSVKLLFIWARESAFRENRGDSVDDSSYACRWPQPTDPPNWFHVHLQAARKMFGILLDSEIRAQWHGHDEPVYIDGKQAWLEDPVALREWGGDATAARDLGGLRDPFYLADPITGGRVPLMRHVPPPAASRIHLLRSLLPGLYNPADVQDRNVNINGGVLVVDGNSAASAKPIEKLRGDLQEKLAALRAKNGTPAPSHRPAWLPPPVNRDHPSDPVERITGSGERADGRDGPAKPDPAPPPQTLETHPRAYTQPNISARAPAAKPYLRHPAPGPGGRRVV